MKKIRPYILNGLLLTIPVFVWNMIWSGLLPEVYNNIPTAPWQSVVGTAENLFRILFLAVLFITPLPDHSVKAWKWLLYLTGVCIYFLSWLPLVYCADSNWSTSLAGLSAPSWTPVIWMVGIINMGQSFSWGIPYKRWIPYLTVLLFLIFHNLYTLLIIQSAAE